MTAVDHSTLGDVREGDAIARGDDVAEPHRSGSSSSSLGAAAGVTGVSVPTAGISRGWGFDRMWRRMRGAARVERGRFCDGRSLRDSCHRGR